MTPFGEPLDTPAKRWLAALLLGVAAAALRAAMQPLLGQELPFVLAVPAALLAALLLGPGPTLLTAAVPVAALLTPGIPPDLEGPRAATLTSGYALCVLLLTLLSHLRKPHAGDAAGPKDTADAAGLARAGSDAIRALPHTALVTWLRAVLFGALLLPLVAFVGVAWWGYERAKTEADAIAGYASRLAMDHAVKALELATSIAQAADAATSGSDESIRAAEGAAHQRLADLARGTPGIVNLNVWDRDGRMLSRSDQFPVDRTPSVADRAYFVEQREAGRGTGLSESLTGRQSGKKLFNLVLRRSSADGSFRGVVAVSLAPDYFNRYYETLVADQPALSTFALLRTDGEILARFPPAPDGRTRAPANSPTLASVQAGVTEGTHLLPASPGREERLVSFRKLPGYPAYVVAGVSTAAVHTGWRRFLSILASVTVPITVGLAWVAWVALRKTRQEQARTLELREQMQRAAAAEKAMLESQRLETLAVLTAGVAHDFNNVLAVVRSSLHLQRLKHPALADAPHLKAMARAADTGSRLTRQLLSFSRKQNFHEELVRLQTWLPSIRELLATSRGAGVSIDLAVASDTHPVRVDLAELELALLNLVVNAAHALEGQGGTIRVRAGNVAGSADDQAPPLVAISVQDDGVGIAPEILSRVTEPFFTTRGRGAGSGLGLNQAQAFCQRSGGRLEIASTLGEGTTVQLLLPAAAAPGAPPGAVVPAGVLHGELLLVEDNEDVAQALGTLLREAGLQVHHCRSAREALRYLEGEDTLPGAVLSDVAMPGGMDGIALAQHLRRLYPQLPVVLMTGYAERIEDAVRGSFEVLSKPLVPEQLLGALRPWFTRAEV